MNLDSIIGGAIVLVCGIIAIRWIWLAPDEAKDFRDHYL